MRNVIKIAFSLITLFTIVHNVNGQRYFDERYIYSQAYLHPVLINPGATAHHQGQNLLVNYRNTWATFQGSPKTVTLSYDGLLTDRLGIGVIAFQDKFGALNTTKGQLSFSYIIKSTTNQIGFGLSAEYIKHGLNNFGVDNEILEPGDNLINARRAGTEYIDASFGVYGIYNDQFIYGIALPSLISSRLDETTGDAERDLGFILNVGYKVENSTTGISLTPSIIMKKLNSVPTHLDLNLKLGFLEDKLIGGVNYRLGAEKNLGFLIGLQVERLGFYYSYNVSSLQFQDHNNGSHELTAKLSLGKQKKTENSEM